MPAMDNKSHFKLPDINLMLKLVFILPLLSSSDFQRISAIFAVHALAEVKTYNVIYTPIP